MDKALVVKTVVDKLVASEVSIDKAMIDSANLLNGVLAARLELKLSSGTADAAIAKISQSMAQLSEVRSAIAEAHRDLDRVRAKLGLRTVMTPYGKDGDDNDQTAHLDRVADMIATRRAG